MKKYLLIPIIFSLLFIAQAKAETLIIQPEYTIAGIMEKSGRSLQGYICQTVQVSRNYALTGLGVFMGNTGPISYNGIMGISGPYFTQNDAYAFQNVTGNIISNLQSDLSVTSSTATVTTFTFPTTKYFDAGKYYTFCFSGSGGSSSQDEEIWGKPYDNVFLQNQPGIKNYGESNLTTGLGTLQVIYLEIYGTRLDETIVEGQGGSIDAISKYFNSTSSPFFVDCSAYDNTSIFSSSTLKSIGCELRKAGGWVLTALIIPPDFAKTFFTDAIETAKTAPPFSFIYQTYDTVSSTISSTNTTSTTGELALNFPAPWGKIVIYNTSTLDNSIGTSTKATVFTALQNLMWLGTGVTILFMFL